MTRQHKNRPVLPPRPHYMIRVAKTPYDVPRWYLNNTGFDTWDEAFREIRNMEKDHVSRGFAPYYELSIHEKMVSLLVDPIPVG
jgi:hypothetical protein